MGVKVRITDRFFGKKILKETKKNFSRDLKNEIGDDIIEEILKGNSPVRNHKFKRYSESYAKTKGKTAPVDMLKDGDMLESLEVKQDGKGKVVIEFTDEKAEYHQKGQGKLPVRKLLPGAREKFNLNLTKKILNILKNALKKGLR